MIHDDLSTIAHWGEHVHSMQRISSSTVIYSSVATESIAHPIELILARHRPDLFLDRERCKRDARETHGLLSKNRAKQRHPVVFYHCKLVISCRRLFLRERTNKKRQENQARIVEQTIRAEFKRIHSTRTIGISESPRMATDLCCPWVFEVASSCDQLCDTHENLEIADLYIFWLTKIADQFFLTSRVLYCCQNNALDSIICSEHCANTLWHKFVHGWLSTKPFELFFRFCCTNFWVISYRNFFGAFRYTFYVSFRIFFQVDFSCF